MFDRAECPGLARLAFCFARFWWRVLLSCRLARLDLNSIQLSIAFQDGVLWSLHGRISSFWTSPGCFRRITDMSKSVAGDVSMRTTPGVALRGGKPRREYFNSLHLTTWPVHAERKTCFILALHRTITSSAVSLTSQRLRGLFGGIPTPSATGLKRVRPRKQPLTLSYIQDTSCLSRLSGTWECPRSLYRMLLASYIARTLLVS